MPQAQLGMYRNPDGHERPVGAMALVNPDGSAIERDEHGLTPFERKMLSLLTQIRDRLPEPAVKSAASAPAKPVVKPAAPKD